MAAKAMKKAWEIFKKWGVRTMAKWSEALKLAWAIVKGLIKEEVQKMVELKGTPKQIKWAEDIRVRVIPVVEKVAAEMKKQYIEHFDAEKAQERIAGVEKVFSALINEPSAKFWIEEFGYIDKTNRAISSKVGYLLKDICKANGVSGKIADFFHKVAAGMDF